MLHSRKVFALWGAIGPCLLGLIPASGAATEPDQKPKMNGVFLQLPCPWYKCVYDLKGTLEEKTKLLGELWKKDAGNRQSLGLDTTVVQYTCNDGQVLFSTPVKLKEGVLKPNKQDILYLSLDHVLSNAPKDTEIWVGLRSKTAWVKMNFWSLLASPEPFVEDNAAVATAVLEEAGRRFHGWYIPAEIDNAKIADADETGVVRKANTKLTALVKQVRQHNNKPVAISGFWRDRPSNVSFEAYLGRVEALLKGSGVTVFIFQDGVGVDDSLAKPKGELTAAEVAVLKKRYAALAEVCKKLSIKFWVAVELMVGEGDGTTATDPQRLNAQLKAVRVEGIEKVVGFSGSHHLTPLVANPKAEDLFKGYSEYLKTKP